LRVCPKCGFIDPPEWRNSKFSPWIEVIYFDDLKQLHPELAEKLETNPRVTDKDYEYYKAPKSVYAQRKWIEIAKHEKKFFSVYIERVNHKKPRDANQKKLLEIEK